MKKTFIINLCVLIFVIPCLAQEHNTYGLKKLNNVLKSGIKSDTLFYESFEGIEVLPDGWSVIDGGEIGHTWVNHPGGMFPVAHTGTRAAVITWADQNDDYLITPQFTVREGDELTFWTRSLSADDMDSFELRISTTDATSPDAFSILVESVEEISPVWTKYCYTLSEIPGVNIEDDIYVAFRNTANDKFGQTVDDVCVAEISDTPVVDINYDHADHGLVTVGNSFGYGDAFSIKNIGGGTLEILSISDLSNLEFTTTIDTEITLQNEESHDFGFSYIPEDEIADDIDFIIETNGGTITITLKGVGSILPEQTVEVGDDKWAGTALPMDPYYRYTYSQCLYHKSELGIPEDTPKDITGAYWLFNGNSLFTEDIIVYMGHISAESMTQGQWIDPNSLYKVYEGELTTKNEESWVGIEFDYPFPYNNTDNLIVALWAKDDDYYNDEDEFYATPIEGPNSLRSLTKYLDNAQIDFSNMPYPDHRQYIANIRLSYDIASNEAYQLENNLSLKNTPNPFTDQTSIEFTLSKNTFVNVSIYNLAGKLVRELANQSFEAGQNEIIWDGNDTSGQKLSAGIYLYKLKTNESTKVKRMIKAN